ncbi:MAG: MBL fold metallo-hydrolase [Anaerolineae bacterium]|nr:MBL fold metallo-hydrolase [Anaerolineae bacterium]
MLLKRFYHQELAQASYLVGCQATGEALVIDPNRSIEQYIEAAGQEGLRISAVTETHIHADYVSGARELAARTGAQLYLSDAGPAEWQYRWAEAAGAVLVNDGDSFMVGNIRLETLHTPGHTPEHISFLLTDTRASDRPMGLFSGDFVFVGDVGRPDLLERAAGYANTMEAGARTLFRSLQRFRQLPDYLQVWPAHGAGSACGKALGAVPSSTVGYEKLTNWALQIETEAEFVQEVLAGQPEPPVYFAQMKRINRDGAAPRPAAPPPPSVDALGAAHAAGQTVVDTRPADQYAAAHSPGTLNLPADGPFLTWAGWLLPYDRPFSLIVAPQTQAAVLADLAAIGLDGVASLWPTDAVAEWAKTGRPIAGYQRQTARELEPLITRNGVVLLDVRFPREYEAGRLAKSRLIPLSELPQRLGELPTDTTVVVTCQGGSRSPIAASLLTGHGWSNVIEMRDGMDGWTRAGLPVTNK